MKRFKVLFKHYGRIQWVRYIWKELMHPFRLCMLLDARMNSQCGIEKLKGLYDAMILLNKEKVSGDVVEIGVAKGGSAYILKRLSNGRKTWFFDTEENDVVQVLKGDVKDTLQFCTASEIALLHIDLNGRMNKFCLEKLYHRITKGGFIFLDNYINTWESHQVVNEFLMSIGFDIREIKYADDRGGCYWRKN